MSRGEVRLYSYCMLQEEKEIYRRLILKDVIIFYIKESMYVQDLFSFCFIYSQPANHRESFPA